MLSGKSKLDLKNISDFPEQGVLDLDSQKCVIPIIIPDEYCIEYPFLLLQPADCYLFIRAMSDKNRQTAEYYTL